MQTIKIVQKRPEAYTPNDQSEKDVPHLIDEVNIFGASWVYRRSVSVKWKHAEEWRQNYIGMTTDLMVFGEDPFTWSAPSPEPLPDTIKYFTYIAFRDGDNQYRNIIITEGMVYIMNEKGQTVDCF